MSINNPKEVWNAIINAKNPICIVDSRPDFDAFGSALSIYYALQTHQKDLKVIYFDNIPEWIKEKIHDVSMIEEVLDSLKFDFSSYDLLIFPDCSSISHITNTIDFLIPEQKKTLNIDHHSTNNFVADFKYFRESSSTCRLIFEIFTRNSVKITPQIGRLLLLGHLTDTGFLQYRDVDSDDYRMVAGLKDLGTDLFKIYSDFSLNESLDNLRFTALVCERATIDKSKKYAYTYYDADDLAARKIDISKVARKGSDIVKTLKGTDFGFSVKRDSNGLDEFDVSFRARNENVDVSVFAKHFGGGGHKPAASGKIKGVKDIKSAIQVAKDYLKTQGY